MDTILIGGLIASETIDPTNNKLH